MKKIIFVLTTLMLAAPVMAGVGICYNQAGGKVALKYDASAEAELVRAFALDITVEGATITGVEGANPSYGIYPGSIVIDEDTGQVTNDGTPVADAGEYDGTLDGLGTGGVTIEMGSLYADGETPPAKTGDIITLVLSGAASSVTIAENVIRGGVVMEDPAVASNCTFGVCPGDGCPGDLDDNDQVDLDDLQAVAQILLDVGSPFIAPVPPANAAADLDSNGQVDLDDLQAVAQILLDVGSPFIAVCP